ncbi:MULTISPECIES: GntR family transcriptional regulator [Rhizobiaceae]|uniref:GntR family transcriptional regulator n=1 Tax=Rhizobiaceae TaxID=82115 RepID=UPI002412C5F2|nr:MULTISPECIES: GntR family transcriptional regulator [Rhizobiaceae]MDG3580293.1 GntR family transcriptional regulator [Rhizobium sp. YJ-22]
MKTPKKVVSLKRIDFQSMQDKVYEQIRDVLMRGGFEPGQKVSSRKLAAVLGTSDMPVRAALGRLLAEGALVQNANGTFAVPLISQRKFHEVMTLRAMLEGEATRQACGHINRAGFTELHRYSAGLATAIEHNRIDDYLDYNQRLKFTIYRHSSSQTLRNMIQLLWLQAGPFLRHLNQGLEQMVRANFHDEAIEALEKGDSSAAAAAISRDILAGMAYLEEHSHFMPEEEPVTGEKDAGGLHVERIR